jgi:hypothetical protein
MAKSRSFTMTQSMNLSTLLRTLHDGRTHRGMTSTCINGCLHPFTDSFLYRSVRTAYAASLSANIRTSIPVKFPPKIPTETNPGTLNRCSFSFCSHPYVLDPGTKSKLLQLDANNQMRSQIRGALFRSIFGGSECPYLILKVCALNP